MVHWRMTASRARLFRTCAATRPGSQPLSRPAACPEMPSSKGPVGLATMSRTVTGSSAAKNASGARRRAPRRRQAEFSGFL
ncbi:hypothetical protein AQI88_06280 [Streptomyces cellostaticus]|uniref:Uncharacterized protein n=1 Tax=Streptomyces cellostaticus TaxID=67285 RepID=A0A101NQI7_9ACTN|nr:hypothetical protein AQI88_06280 [Streptomyces cellostaticus]